jgi:hypothetical protein
MNLNRDQIRIQRGRVRNRKSVKKSLLRSLSIFVRLRLQSKISALAPTIFPKKLRKYSRIFLALYKFYVFKGSNNHQNFFYVNNYIILFLNLTSNF